VEFFAILGSLVLGYIVLKLAANFVDKADKEE
jgi:hypothetical protein